VIRTRAKTFFNERTFTKEIYKKIRQKKITINNYNVTHKFVIFENEKPVRAAMVVLCSRDNILPVDKGSAARL